jgi:hypothetical protein
VRLYGGQCWLRFKTERVLLRSCQSVCLSVGPNLDKSDSRPHRKADLLFERTHGFKRFPVMLVDCKDVRIATESAKTARQPAQVAAGCSVPVELGYVYRVQWHPKNSVPIEDVLQAQVKNG